MKRMGIMVHVAAGLALAGCGTGDDTSHETTQSDNTPTMEGGGAYPSPAPTLAVEPLATDPAATATQNEAENLAPSSSGAPASGNRAGPSDGTRSPAGR